MLVWVSIVLLVATIAAAIIGFRGRDSVTTVVARLAFAVLLVLLAVSLVLLSN